MTDSYSNITGKNPQPLMNGWKQHIMARTRASGGMLVVRDHMKKITSYVDNNLILVTII
jgi:hypothetical protein